MSYEERQAQLLDEYLTALQKNPHAPIPDELEPDMADFARMFMTEQQAEASSPVKYRVWKNIHATQTDDQQRTQSYQERETHMAKLKEKKKPSGRFGGWLPITAVAILTVVIGIGIAGMQYYNSRNNISDYGVPPQFALTGTAIMEQATILAAEATPTSPGTPITATLAPSATPDIDATNIMAMTWMPTSTPMPTATNTFTPTADAFALRATEIIIDATSTQRALTAPTAIAFDPQATFDPANANNPNLECDFEGELLFRINQNTINESDALIIWGAARNSRTENGHLEIFGGYLTDDEFQTMVDIINPPQFETLLAWIDGTSYPAGSYLVQLRLTDSSGETLSSCALPVTFTGE